MMTKNEMRGFLREVNDALLDLLELGEHIKERDIRLSAEADKALQLLGCAGRRTDIMRRKILNTFEGNKGD